MSLSDELEPLARRFCDASQGRWTFDAPIKPGGSAAVYKVKDTANQPAALKIYDPRFLNDEQGDVTRKRLEQQRALIGHTCRTLVQYVDVGILDNTAFVLMEFLPWPDLSDCLDNIDPDRIRELIRQIANAAKFLEGLNLCHRDIKPANVAVSPDGLHAKLLDLGVLRALGSEGAGTDEDGKLPFVATAQYSSPEYLFRLEAQGLDLWRGLTFYQLGGVLHDVIMRRALFEEYANKGNRYVIAYAVANKVPEVAASVDASLILLARDCLEKDLRRRLQLVTWDRFDGTVDASIETARKRLGLRSYQLGTVAHAGENEHQHKLEQVAHRLRQLVEAVLDVERFPPARRNVASSSATEARLQVAFKPPPEIGNMDIEFNFELSAPLAHDRCSIHLVSKGGQTEFVGSVVFSNTDSEVSMLNDRVTGLMIKYYELAVSGLLSGESGS